MSEQLRVAVIGGGLVGCVAALNLAELGHDVHVYEYRSDIRSTEQSPGRSINLALSHRGRKALRQVGCEDVVLSTAIPMRGRMLHDQCGNTTVILYDPTTKQCLYSVGRKSLNEVLLNAGENVPNIHYYFDHKLTAVNIQEGILEFSNLQRTLHSKADLILGCDGAFSTVRQSMIKLPGFNYSQEYIEHGYKELCIPAKDNNFQMPPNYLHIWPRDEFMMIALPNQDKSFTVTLSMPFTVFDSIHNAKDLIKFFTTYYADALPLIGHDQLIHDFFKSKPQSLVSIKCQPYHHKSRALLIGDAAHAMVPYYGQGMNAGMEDCTLLMAILQQPGIKMDDALYEFTRQRTKDAHAICDLAMYNYVEMRDLTKRLSFRCRRCFDTFLFRYLPTFWIPLYNSVTFTSMPYHKCIQNKKWQDNFLKKIIVFAALIPLLGWFVFVNCLNKSDI